MDQLWLLPNFPSLTLLRERPSGEDGLWGGDEKYNKVYS